VGTRVQRIYDIQAAVAFLRVYWISDIDVKLFFLDPDPFNMNIFGSARIMWDFFLRSSHSSEPLSPLCLAVKAALLLGLFGGTARALTPAAEFTVRGDPHILLVGDPGLGKSQLLNAVAGVAPR
jgi:hypothetical protein